jgi:hypothetical protein
MTEGDPEMKAVSLTLLTLTLTLLGLFNAQSAKAESSVSSTKSVREVANEYCAAYIAHRGDLLANLYKETDSTETLFQDPVFGPLDSKHTKFMWRMLMMAPNNLNVTCRVERKIGSFVEIKWTADYIFSGSGAALQVNNAGTTYLAIAGGKIIQQTDAFDYCNWTRMALGDQEQKICKDPNGTFRKALLAKLEGFIKMVVSKQASQGASAPAAVPGTQFAQ